MSAVTYESVDCVAIVTIDQPEKRNALSRQVVDELAEAWRRFGRSGDRVAVLTATGDKAFTVGADLNDPTIYGGACRGSASRSTNQSSESRTRRFPAIDDYGGRPMKS